jgi:hypothetical protein
MPDQESSDLTPEQMHTIVANRLAITFDEVAKEAMQAAAIARDHSVSFLDKLDDANGRVTLIVETAMRGLGRANRAALNGAIRILMQDEGEES